MIFSKYRKQVWVEKHKNTSYDFRETLNDLSSYTLNITCACGVYTVTLAICADQLSFCCCVCCCCRKHTVRISLPATHCTRAARTGHLESALHTRVKKWLSPAPSCSTHTLKWECVKPPQCSDSSFSLELLQKNRTLNKYKAWKINTSSSNTAPLL